MDRNILGKVGSWNSFYFMTCLSLFYREDPKPRHRRLLDPDYAEPNRRIFGESHSWKYENIFTPLFSFHERERETWDAGKRRHRRIRCCLRRSWCRRHRSRRSALRRPVDCTVSHSAEEGPRPDESNHSGALALNSSTLKHIKIPVNGFFLLSYIV